MGGGLRILREVKILGELRHSHVVQIVDVVNVRLNDSLDLYIVLERCDTDLQRVCHDMRGLSLPQVRRLSYNLLVGCSYLHSKQVYHRDLKPANCLTNKD